MQQDLLEGLPFGRARHVERVLQQSLLYNKFQGEVQSHQLKACRLHKWFDFWAIADEVVSAETGYVFECFEEIVDEIDYIVEYVEIEVFFGVVIYR